MIHSGWAEGFLPYLIIVGVLIGFVCGIVSGVKAHRRANKEGR